MKKIGLKILSFGFYALVLYAIVYGIGSVIGTSLFNSNNNNDPIDIHAFDWNDKSKSKKVAISDHTIDYPSQFKIIDNLSIEGLMGLLSLNNNYGDEISFKYCISVY